MSQTCKYILSAPIPGICSKTPGFLSNFGVWGNKMYLNIAFVQISTRNKDGVRTKSAHFYIKNLARMVSWHPPIPNRFTDERIDTWGGEYADPEYNIVMKIVRSR